MKLHPLTGGKELYVRFTAELIAISAGSANKEGLEVELDDIKVLAPWASAIERGVVKFHNVLWIEWEDGLAYRRGLGRAENGIRYRPALRLSQPFLAGRIPAKTSANPL
jgi:hypothetical protein